MQGEDCTVLSAFDGNRALSILGEQAVDIVVSDWMMPGLGGALLCQTMKNDASLAHIPFLMISGIRTRRRSSATTAICASRWTPKRCSAVNRLCAAKKRPLY